MHVPLSLKSSEREIISLPTKSTRLLCPLFISESATESPNVNPAQAADKSKAKAPFIPNFPAIKAAVEGKKQSGVNVAQITASMLSALIWAFATAFFAASNPRDEAASLGAFSQILLCLIPVL
jgi:hypothetical protein